MKLTDLCNKYPTDKGTTHSYLEVYDRLFSGFRLERFNLLEIGVCDGGSMMLWREYFPNACIHGVDKHPRINKVEGCILFNDEDATDEMFADSIGLSLKVMIDDGSHVLDEQLKTWFLWKHKLTPDGIYVVEDLVEGSIPAFERLGFTIFDRRYLERSADDILAIKFKEVKP